LAIGRVIRGRGLVAFLREVLEGQSPSARVGGIAIKPINTGKPRALIYVGPLERERYERVKDLVQPNYKVSHIRNVAKLAEHPTATADDPLGY
jgi:hypothetical protein